MTLQLDPRFGRVEHEGKRVFLSRAVFEVLEKLLPDGATLEELQDGDTEHDRQMARLRITRLRRKLAGWPFEVVNYRGYGYQLEEKETRPRTEARRAAERRRSKAKAFKEMRRLYMQAYRNRQ